MRLAVLLVIGLSACGDDLTLVVDVEHRIPVAKTVISVYESDSLDCTKIEFGDVDAAALSAALVAEEIHDASGVTGSLDGISRTERKYVVARGYDADGTLLTAGCATKDVVGGVDHLSVIADEALTVSAIVDTSDTAGYSFIVIASAPDGSPPSAHRKISWQVYGPDGTKPVRSDLAVMVPPEPNQPQQSDWVPSKDACTNTNGVARIHPVPPDQIGGFATRIRASWMANTLPLQSTLSKVDSTSLEVLRPAASVTRPCAIKTAGGEQRLVCLDTQLPGPTNVAREYRVTASAGRGKATQTNMTAVAGSPVALISLPSASGRDVYVVDGGGGLVPLFASGAPNLTACSTCTVQDALYMPSCSDDGDAKILIQVGALQLRTFTPKTGARAPVLDYVDATSVPGTLKNIALDQAGCVTEIVPSIGTKQRQAVTFSARSDVLVNAVPIEIPTSHGFYGCTPSTCSKLDLPAGEAGTAFVSVDANENRIVGAAADASGVVLSSWVVTTGASNDVHRLIERDRVPSAALPNHIAAGKLDDDGGYDIVTDFSSKRGSTLEIAYSRLAAGQRLEAISGPLALQFSQLVVEDITNDGLPDLIAIGALGGPVPVLIVPTHVAALETVLVAEQCN